MLKQQVAVDGWTHLHQNSNGHLEICPDAREVLLNAKETESTSLFGEKSSRCGKWRESRSIGSPVQIRSPAQEGSSLLC
ncbi:hypothetical protein SLEP1_g27997 [Rubroshorea leprosula]|uniref:Uncharacterized protein n=1 Tax=Rubroshorea leprosula TaxID=152421 RepID=A0AAV5K1J6_9ROSI|nr:hypothetical protein SLEP1_g27997 [Rubroshorea leprosula]